ncbi:hypothetical protein [Devosia lacusdianchii]|uniref:hypothetical protein n=1 Tax=Devosia lacusdianchii TaxID=2917991 RepID=UPI001F06DC68|nr:hypothetical protein [Devosia sp. JXJ CY 41]
MTSDEADQRIILSRQTLRDYLSLAAIGEGAGPLDRTLIADEIRFLEAIAEDYPSKAEKLARLVSEWVAFLDGLKAKLH